MLATELNPAVDIATGTGRVKIRPQKRNWIVGMFPHKLQST